MFDAAIAFIALTTDFRSFAPSVLLLKFSKVSIYFYFDRALAYPAFGLARACSRFDPDLVLVFPYSDLVWICPYPDLSLAYPSPNPDPFSVLPYPDLFLVYPGTELIVL